MPPPTTEKNRRTRVWVGNAKARARDGVFHKLVRACLVLAEADASLLVCCCRFKKLATMVELIQVEVERRAVGKPQAMAGWAPRLSAAMVGYGILLAFITLPLTYELMQFLA